MRLILFTLFTLTSFLSLGSCHISIEKALSFNPTDTTESLIIEHSLPRGNGSLDATGRNGYNDPSGKNFAYRVFWVSVINKNAASVEFSMNFPANSFDISGQPKGYVKFFLPPGTMTPEKESMFDYGLTSLKSFLDTNFYKPTQLRRTIKTNEEYRFYIAAVSHLGYNGVVRGELVLKGQNLFYKINMLDSLLPCGSIVLKK